MTALRHHLLHHPRLIAWIVASALLMKLLVPAGFMPVFGGDGVTIQLCTGFGPQAKSMAMPGMADHGQGKNDHDQGESGKDMPCGFGGLTTASLAAADPILLKPAPPPGVSPVVAMPPRRAERSATRLRPPLRGPPASL